VTALIGDTWTVREATIIIAIDKRQHPIKETMDRLWSICPSYNIIVLDHFVDTSNLSDVAWRTLGNVDWRRDIVIKDGPVDHFDASDAPRGQIGIDATAKGPEDGHPRGWPEEIEMSPEIKQLVDRKWPEYGIT
jgi:4-hydroxy-3-polyprenylbenzoate decarboxylase